MSTAILFFFTSTAILYCILVARAFANLGGG
jgi:hypothetical protein